MTEGKSFIFVTNRRDLKFTMPFLQVQIKYSDKKETHARLSVCFQFRVLFQNKRYFNHSSAMTDSTLTGTFLTYSSPA